MAKAKKQIRSKEVAFQAPVEEQAYSGGRILALDFGTKFVGLATYLPGVDPYPLPYDRIANDQKLMPMIKKIVTDEDIENLLFGLPYLTDGKPTDMTVMAFQFAMKIKSGLAPIKIFFQDETLSSFEAEERMKKDARYGFKVDKLQVDPLAAAILLEDFSRRIKTT